MYVGVAVVVGCGGVRRVAYVDVGSVYVEVVGVTDVAVGVIMLFSCGVYEVVDVGVGMLIVVVVVVFVLLFVALCVRLLVSSVLLLLVLVVVFMRLSMLVLAC